MVRQPIRGPVGAAGRVAAVHGQARPTLGLAVAFSVAAGIAVAVPHRTGAWLPLHLFLLGGLLLAVSAATQLLAVTWGAAPAPPARTVAAQRALIACGAIGLASARELGWPTPVMAAAGLAVVSGLVVLGSLLWGLRAGAVQDRFAPVVDHYLVAVGFGVAGSVAGIFLAAGIGPVSAARLRTAHLTVNLLGLVGVVVAGSLPWFVATTAKVRVSKRVTARRQRTSLALLAVSTTTAAVGGLTDSRVLTGLGFAGYAVAMVGVVAMVSRLGTKQLRWAGPRLIQLLAGTTWLAGAVAVAAAQGALSSRAVLVLIVGGYGQILAGAVAYLGPVLRGGGHERLAAGFRVTRSWLGLAAANVAALAAAASMPALLGAAVVVWATDVCARCLLLVHGTVRSTSSGADLHR